MLGAAHRAAFRAGEAVQGEQPRVDAAVAGGTRDVAASMAYPYDRGQGWMECPGDGGHRRASK